MRMYTYIIQNFMSNDQVRAIYINECSKMANDTDDLSNRAVLPGDTMFSY